MTASDDETNKLKAASFYAGAIAGHYRDIAKKALWIGSMNRDVVETFGKNSGVVLPDLQPAEPHREVPFPYGVEEFAACCLEVAEKFDVLARRYPVR